MIRYVFVFLKALVRLVEMLVARKLSVMILEGKREGKALKEATIFGKGERAGLA